MFRNNNEVKFGLFLCRASLPQGRLGPNTSQSPCFIKTEVSVISKIGYYTALSSLPDLQSLSITKQRSSISYIGVNCLPLSTVPVGATWVMPFGGGGSKIDQGVRNFNSEAKKKI